MIRYVEDSYGRQHPIRDDELYMYAEGARSIVAEEIARISDSGSVIQKAAVTLSSAQLLDLHNTPVTLVAAPGAGHYLDVHRITVYFRYGTAPYTGDTENVSVKLGANSLTSFDITDTVDDVQVWPGTVNSFVATSVVNKAVTAAIDNPLSDGDGTMTIIVYYTVEDVPA